MGARSLVSPREDRCCHFVAAEIKKKNHLLKVAFSGIMHEKDELCLSFLIVFMPHTFQAIPLTEQLVSLVQNGMYCCICAPHGKCQQFDCVFLNGLPKGLL